MTVSDALESGNSVLVMGPRLHGKSHLLARVADERGAEGCVHSRPADWLEDGAADPAGLHLASDDITHRRVAEQVQLALNDAAESGLWLVDDTDLLLPMLGATELQALVDAVQAGLRVVFARNPLVVPTGRLAALERALLGNPTVVQLLPMPSDEARALALTVYCADLQSESAMASKSDWLTAWSGGIPGLLRRLSGVAPLHAPQDHCPPVVSALIDDDAGSWGLETPVRRQVVAAACANSLPPDRCLAPPEAAALGYLRALGAISTSGSKPSAIQGLYWAQVLERHAGPYPGRNAHLEDLALGLADLFVRTGMHRLAAAALGTAAEVVDIADALERAARWSMHTVGDSYVDGLGRSVASALGAGPLSEVAHRALEPVTVGTPLEQALELIRIGQAP